jgi:hypothetical protein
MTKVSKNGHNSITTEFEVRELDKHGDTVDVQHYDTLNESKDAARSLMDRKAVSVIVEKHTSRAPARGTQDVYQTVFMLGNWAALREGGWQNG